MALYNHLVFIIQHILFWIIRRYGQSVFSVALFWWFGHHAHDAFHLILIWLFQYADNKSGY